MNKPLFIKNKKIAQLQKVSLLCNMKTSVLLSVFLIGLGLQSCQSEYSERMARAIELKRKHTALKVMFTESENPGLKSLIGELEKEITIQAKISGNEELFLKEIWKR